MHKPRWSQATSCKDRKPGKGMMKVGWLNHAKNLTYNSAKMV